MIMSLTNKAKQPESEAKTKPGNTDSTLAPWCASSLSQFHLLILTKTNRKETINNE